jgi:hypothetical protein
MTPISMTSMTPTYERVRSADQLDVDRKKMTIRIFD